MRRIVVAVLLALVAVPASIISTVALFPLWGFLERRFGIESVGHSGPAEWCFVTVYVIWTIFTWVAWLAVVRRAERSPDSQRDPARR
jgi:hypothetical protein